MPPVHLAPTSDQIIAKLLRRVEALELKLDQSKQHNEIVGAGVDFEYDDGTRLFGLKFPGRVGFTGSEQYLDLINQMDDGSAEIEAYLFTDTGDAQMLADATAGFDGGEAWTFVEGYGTGATADLVARLSPANSAEIEASAGDGQVAANQIRVTTVELLFNGISEPPDADLENGQLGIWFDPTPGSASFNVKAKDTAGTIVTGSVALS